MLGTFVRRRRSTVVYVKGSNLRLSGSAIGDTYSGDGLASIFDNTTNGNNTFIGSRTTLYAGRDFSASAKRIFEAIAFGSNADGWVNGANPSVTIQIRGSHASAPADVTAAATHGSQLGTLTFTDTANESAGRTITIVDNTVQWEYVWAHVQQAGGATFMYFIELQLFEAVP